MCREKERGRKREPNFFLQSTEFRRLEIVEPRVKAHLLDEGYAWVPKMRDITKYPKEEISRNNEFQAREASHLCYHAPRGR